MRIAETSNSSHYDVIAAPARRSPVNRLQDPRIAAALDNLHRDGWKEACLPVLQLLEPTQHPGACIFCADMKGFRNTRKPYVHHVRSHPERYVSPALPLGEGLELSVRL